ncbi:hypothetical protein Flav3CDRAFT_1336 [Flavobacteria bacterium MS024-3C]|nr:hypothetical protein Flav3CDRAFT_1336 [Flavobacteria bacterium MS024-3C]
MYLLMISIKINTLKKESSLFVSNLLLSNYILSTFIT